MKVPAALILCVASAACAASVVVERHSGVRFRRPPHCEPSKDGVVYAYDRDLAERASSVLGVVRPRLQRILPHDASEPEVWFLDQERVLGSDGLYLEGRSKQLIAIGTNGTRSLEFTLTHELAHWYSHASGIELPVVVEEGLADMATMMVLPECVDAVLLLRGAASNPTSWTRQQALALTYEDWMALSGKVEMELRSIGFLLVLELGTKDLAELRETARAQGLRRVPAEWFLGEGPGGAYARLK